MTPSPRDRALSRLAEIADPEVLHCWRVMVEAVDRGWLTADGPLSAGTLADALAVGGGLGAGAYGVRADGDRAAVTYFGERLTCLRGPLIDELRGLHDSLHDPAPLDAGTLDAAMAALDRISLPRPPAEHDQDRSHRNVEPRNATDPPGQADDRGRQRRAGDNGSEPRPRNGRGAWSGQADPDRGRSRNDTTKWSEPADAPYREDVDP